MREDSSGPRRLLFVCSRNRWRSPTAEKLCAAIPGIATRSAGTEPSARVRVSEKHLAWAEIVFCMERSHVARLRERFPDTLQGKRIECLDIPDDYEFMDAELVDLLRTALSDYLPVIKDENKPDSERNLGPQPMTSLLEAHALKAADLVAASQEHLTHKMVARACKGRRLTPNVQGKVLRALNAASRREYALGDLFNY